MLQGGCSVQQRLSVEIIKIITSDSINYFKSGLKANITFEHEKDLLISFFWNIYCCEH